MLILIIDNKFNHIFTGPTMHFSQCQSISFSSKTKASRLQCIWIVDCCFDLKCDAELHSETTLLIHTPGDFMELAIPLYD